MSLRLRGELNIFASKAKKIHLWLFQLNFTDDHLLRKNKVIPLTYLDGQGVVGEPISSKLVAAVFGPSVL